jgi:hypothetical protein
MRWCFCSLERSYLGACERAAPSAISGDWRMCASWHKADVKDAIQALQTLAIVANYG